MKITVEIDQDDFILAILKNGNMSEETADEITRVTLEKDLAVYHTTVDDDPEDRDHCRKMADAFKIVLSTYS
jgi:hypothetical protein